MKKKILADLEVLYDNYKKQFGREYQPYGYSVARSKEEAFYIGKIMALEGLVKF